MHRRQRLAASLGVAPGEGLLVTLLFLLTFCSSGAFVLGYLGGNALAISTFGSDVLAYVYLSAAALLVASGLGFARAEARVPLAWLLVAPWAVLMALGLAMYLWLSAGGPAWLTFALLSWSFVVLNFGDLSFWALAGRLMNLEQGKRLFGLIGAGALVSRLVLYMAGAAMVRAIGALNLAAVALALMFAALALTIVIARRFELQPAGAPAQAARATAPRRADPSRRWYVALLLASGFLGELIYNLGDFLVFQQVALVSSEPDDLATFFGLYSGTIYLVAALASAFVTGLLLRRLGVRATLLVERVAVIAGAGVVLALGVLGGPGAPLLLSVLALNVAHNIANRGVSRPAGQLLFQPIPAAERLPAQSLAQSVMDPLSLGVAGALLLLFRATGELDVTVLAALLLALTVVWVPVTLSVYAGYVAALSRALARRLVGTATVSLDARGLAVVERALTSRRPVEVLSALDLLRSERPELYAARLPALLAHPEPGVRGEVVRRLGALGLREAAPALRAVAASEEDAGLRAAAVGALGELGEPPAAALDDPAPEVRVAALVGLLRAGDRAAAVAIDRLGASADPAERALGARVAGGARDATLLARFLADPRADVRRAALLAAGPWAPAPVWEAALAALDDPATRGAAAAALVAGGAAALPQISAALAGETAGRELRLRLTRVCGRIAAPEARAALEARLGAADDDLRDAAIQALRRRGYVAGPAAPLVRARLAAEAALAAEMGALLADLADAPETALLRDALAAQLARLRRRALTLLGFLADPGLARAVEEGLAAPSAERRAYALELIETRVRPELRAALAPALRAGEARRGGAERLAPLEALITAPDDRVPPWVRACALYSAGLLGDARLAAAAVGPQRHPDPAVREMAAWAAARLAAVPREADEARARPGERPEGRATMLTTVERVIILKGVAIFAGTPDAVLAEVAALLEEEEVPAGTSIFAKGDAGDSLYIVAEGEVRVHDGPNTLNHLREGDVFGEMAILDPAPRSASVTSASDTLLLRLDAEPFAELMGDQPEIARGVIRVLSGRLRDRMADLQAARDGAAGGAAGTSVA